MTEPNETPLKPQLLPCPFCGTPEPKYRHNGPYPPEIAQTTTIECSNPDCRASIHRGWAPEPVIAAWNRRADPAPAPHNDATCQYAPVGNEFDWNKSDTTGLPLHDATGFFAAPAGRAGNTATLADSMNALMSFEPTPDIPTRDDILPAPAACTWPKCRHHGWRHGISRNLERDGGRAICADCKGENRYHQFDPGSLSAAEGETKEK